MNEIGLIFRHELLAFLKSGKSSILLLAITTLTWGGFITQKIDTINSASSYLWVLFFALVAGAGLSTTVFVRERVSATLEILIMSGIERNNILIGKLLFTTSMTIAVGVGAFAVSFLLRAFIFKDTFLFIDELLVVLALYCSSAIFISNTSALFSIILSNPRLVQFVNFTLLAIVSFIFGILAPQNATALYALSFILIISSLLFYLLTRHVFKHEKIIQPLIY